MILGKSNPKIIKTASYVNSIKNTEKYLSSRLNDLYSNIVKNKNNFEGILKLINKCTELSNDYPFIVNEASWLSISREDIEDILKYYVSILCEFAQEYLDYSAAYLERYVFNQFSRGDNILRASEDEDIIMLTNSRMDMESIYYNGKFYKVKDKVFMHTAYFDSYAYILRL